MSDRSPITYSKAAVAWIVAREGMGYAIRGYMDETAIEDPELREEWRKAREAMGRIEALLPTEDEEGNPIEM